MTKWPNREPEVSRSVGRPGPRAFWLALLLLVISLIAAGWTLGPRLAGRALLALGLPLAAAQMLDDSAWKGFAFYKAGRWREAAQSFGRDPASAYDLGNALALCGRYAEAVAAYDAALRADPDDEDAAANKALLLALLARENASGDATANSTASAQQRARADPDSDTGGGGEGAAGDRETRSRPGEKGGAKASKLGKGQEQTDESGAGATGAVGASEGAGRTGGQKIDVAALLNERDRRVRRRLEARSVKPSLEWLQTLADDPGRFLKLRIAAEKTRRLRAAGGPLEEDD
jgi:Ca-activated chloride channel family protein